MSVYILLLVTHIVFFDSFFNIYVMSENILLSIFTNGEKINIFTDVFRNGFNNRKPYFVKLFCSHLDRVIAALQKVRH